MGETVMDILFRKEPGKGSLQPFSATPGGSSFNSIISVGRAGIPCAFIGYTGDDRIGHQTLDFLRHNNVQTDYFLLYDGMKSSLALAFLDSNGDAEYNFYKDIPHLQYNWPLPDFTPSDTLLFGSYYAICNGMRQQVETVVQNAFQAGATIYYDINFRRTHINELETLLPVIQWNMQHSSIVRGSADDFDIMFGTRNAEQIYYKHILPYCTNFIFTAGAGQITVFTNGRRMDFTAQAIPANRIISTVGAGDNFNAGFLCELTRSGDSNDNLSHLTQSQWSNLVQTAIHFASAVCQSTSNNIPVGFRY